MSSIKAPPVFQPEEDDDYQSWKSDVKVWKVFTDTKPDKVGAAVYLSLKGKAREVVRGLTIEEMTTNGFDRIIAELDKVYLKDETTRAYCAFKDFFEFNRSAGQNFSDFIAVFDQKYREIKKYNMELPDGVQAFFLLKSANISQESEKLARTTAKLEYTDMREKLMRIFGDPGVLSESGAVPEVKQEALYGSYTSRGRGRFRGGYRGSSSSNRENVTGAQKSSSFRGGGGARPRTYSCYRCNSKSHFIADCPHPPPSGINVNEEANLTVHISLFNSKLAANEKSLQVEALSKGVLDSGCSKTVAGMFWLTEFVKNLSDRKRGDIVEKPSRALFRFGDGVQSRSMKCVTVPVVIGKSNFELDVEIVNNEIPLLISKGAMKQMKMKLDFDADTAEIDGVKTKLVCTSTGHYCVPLTELMNQETHGANFVLELQCIDGLSLEEKRKKALKLHRQFAHAHKDKLRKLLKNSGCQDQEFYKCIDDCYDKCELCQKYRKPPLRPVVGYPLAQNFNEVVCMDLKQIEPSLWILHLIDAATRYSSACLVKNKRKETIISSIFQIWIRYFGRPIKFFSDNGGEFANEEFKMMNEQLNIETVVTAAESPFSNGIVERHNRILAEAMMKTLADVKCDKEMALAWAVSAKNALQNNNGFSPNQLVFGYNVNLPNVLVNLPPALEVTTSSEIVRKQLEAMHSARQNYIKAESSERIKRALKHQTRTYADDHFENGEKVFYRRKEAKGWKGPATVIGMEGKIVLLRHGSSYYRCHPCHLMKVLKRENTTQQENTTQRENTTQQHNEVIERRATESETVVHPRVTRSNQRSSSLQNVGVLEWSTDEWSTDDENDETGINSQHGDTEEVQIEDEIPDQPELSITLDQSHVSASEVEKDATEEDEVQPIQHEEIGWRRPFNVDLPFNQRYRLISDPCSDSPSKCPEGVGGILESQSPRNAVQVGEGQSPQLGGTDNDSQYSSVVQLGSVDDSRQHSSVQLGGVDNSRQHSLVQLGGNRLSRAACFAAGENGQGAVSPTLSRSVEVGAIEVVVGVAEEHADADPVDVEPMDDIPNDSSTDPVDNLNAERDGIQRGGMRDWDNLTMIANEHRDEIEEIEEIHQDQDQEDDDHEESIQAPVDINYGNDARPNSNSRVVYMLYDGTVSRAKVLSKSKQPKRKGAHSNWLNVHVDGEEKPSAVNWIDVITWKEISQHEEVLILSEDGEFGQTVMDAKEAEIKNLMDNDVFDEVEYEGQFLISCRWIVTEKIKDGITKTKARLVARGFEERKTESRTDSPTCSRQSLRMAFVTAATMNWEIESLDVSSAFLQGNAIKRDVYIKPPKEFENERKVWKLKRCLYGLNDAPRAWYDRVKEELCLLGGKTSKFDDAMFLWHDTDSSLQGIIVTHVDDFIYGGTKEWHSMVINKLVQKFKISSQEQGTFKYVGLRVTQIDNAVLLEQNAYIESLKPIELAAEERLDKERTLSDKEKSMLRSLSGQLLWATTQTRPDAAFNTCIVSNYGKSPTVQNILVANKALKKMKANTVCLKFPALGCKNKLEIVAYSDASHANLPSGASQGAIIVFLAGNNSVAPIMWQSKKQSRVTKSPLASETLALADLADAGYLVANIVQEIFGIRNRPNVICRTDSRSLTQHLETSHVIADSRLRVDVARLREMIEMKEITVEWICKEKQLADPMTKEGASSARLLEVLRVAKLC